MTVGEVSSHEETIVLYEINNSHNIELQKTAWGTTEHITLAINNENDTRVTMSLGCIFSIKPTTILCLFNFVFHQ